MKRNCTPAAMFIFALGLMIASPANAELWERLKGAASVLFGESKKDEGDPLFKECLKTAADLNKNAPLPIDKVTTFKGALCFSDANSVTMQYQINLSLPGTGSFGQSDLEILRPIVLNPWCSNPEQRHALNLMNIEYKYFDSKNNYIGAINITSSDCP